MFGIFHFELLPINATINIQVYCQQLECLNAALKKKKGCFRESKKEKSSALSEQYTPRHCKNHTPEDRRTCLKKISSSSSFSRPYSFRILFILWVAKLFEWINSQRPRRGQNRHFRVLFETERFFIDRSKKLVSRWKEIKYNYWDYTDDQISIKCKIWSFGFYYVKSEQNLWVDLITASSPRSFPQNKIYSNFINFF